MNPGQSVFMTIFHRLTLICAYKVKLDDLLIGILMKTRGIAFVGSLFALAALTAQPVSAETSMESVVRSGKLNAVVIGDELPFASKSDAGFKGLAIDVVAAVKNELQAFAGKAIRLNALQVNSVQDAKDALLSGKADIACGVAYSWERAMLVDYTIPFALGGVRVLAPTGNDGTPASLAGKTVGVIKDTVAAQTLETAAPQANYVSYDSPAAALAAMRSGSVDILGGDSLWLKANKARVAANADIVPIVPYGRSGIACIIPENNSTMLNYSNIAIGKILQGYVNDVAPVQAMVNRWIGPGSAVNLKQDLIKAYYATVLSTAAQLSLR